jgi:dUTP pyrophosphatase
VVTRGMRIAQLVISAVERAAWTEVADLPQTTRGTGGYGHTGESVGPL